MDDLRRARDALEYELDRRNDNNALEILRRNPSFIRAKNVHGNYFLFEAVRKGLIEVVNYMLDEIGDDITEIISDSQWNVLHWAASSFRWTEMIPSVMRHIPNRNSQRTLVNQTCRENWTPLMIVLNKLISAEELLIDMRGDSRFDDDSDRLADLRDEYDLVSEFLYEGGDTLLATTNEFVYQSLEPISHQITPRAIQLVASYRDLINMIVDIEENYDMGWNSENRSVSEYLNRALNLREPSSSESSGSDFSIQDRFEESIDVADDDAEDDAEDDGPTTVRREPSNPREGDLPLRRSLMAQLDEAADPNILKKSDGDAVLYKGGNRAVRIGDRVAKTSFGERYPNRYKWYVKGKRTNETLPSDNETLFDGVFEQPYWIVLEGKPNALSGEPNKPTENVIKVVELADIAYWEFAELGVWYSVEDFRRLKFPNFVSERLTLNIPGKEEDCDIGSVTGSKKIPVVIKVSNAVEKDGVATVPNGKWAYEEEKVGDKLTVFCATTLREYLNRRKGYHYGDQFQELAGTRGLYSTSPFTRRKIVEVKYLTQKEIDDELKKYPVKRKASNPVSYQENPMARLFRQRLESKRRELNQLLKEVSSSEQLERIRELEMQIEQYERQLGAEQNKDVKNLEALTSESAKKKPRKKIYYKL